MLGLCSRPLLLSSSFAPVYRSFCSVASCNLLYQQCASLCSQQSIARRILSRGKATLVSTTEAPKKPERPTSPHLTVYALPLPALMSIAHRGTGAVGTFDVTLLSKFASLYFAGLSYAVSPAGVTTAQLASQLALVSPLIAVPLKAVIAFPFVYHTCTGIRHLIWDTGRQLSVEKVYSTGYTALAVAGVLTLILAFL